MSKIIPISQAKRRAGQGGDPLAVGDIKKTGQVIRIPIYENEKFVIEAASKLAFKNAWFIRNHTLNDILKEKRKPLMQMGLSYDEIEAEFDEFKKRVQKKLLPSDMDEYQLIRQCFHVYDSKQKVMTVEDRYSKESEIHLFEIDVKFDPKNPDFLKLAGMFCRHCALTFGQDAVELRGFSDVTQKNDFFLRYVERPYKWLEAERTWFGWTPNIKKVTVNRMNKLVGY